MRVDVQPWCNAAAVSLMQRLEAMAKASSKKSAAKSSPKAKSKPAAKAKPAAKKSAVAKPASKPAAKAAKASAPIAKKAAQGVQAGKWVYTFGDGRAEGKANMRDLLGGKGANLAEMANLGLPVPPGFTIPTSVCITSTPTEKPIRRI